MEVKANELRIGNYLEDANGRLCVVTEIRGEDSRTQSPASYDAWPVDETIPIVSLPHRRIKFTEKILQDLGFKHSPPYVANNGFFYNDKVELAYDCEKPLDEQPLYLFFRANAYGKYMAEASCVHELQNLWFALFKEELTLKP